MWGECEMHSTYFVNHSGNVIMQMMTAGKVCNVTKCS